MTAQSQVTVGSRRFLHDTSHVISYSPIALLFLLAVTTAVFHRSRHLYYRRHPRSTMRLFSTTGCLLSLCTLSFVRASFSGEFRAHRFELHPRSNSGEIPMLFAVGIPTILRIVEAAYSRQGDGDSRAIYLSLEEKRPCH